ncbi:asteroid-like protein 1 [Moniliophthora roreri MCA 2997]|uniref:Asteroid-like protein 1 n=2 Tax=Moniliophthora roreri TaxID=221103 RepID=V2XMD6_MONRO|nr:asteroid-like protein 1 [Moniliophthora roreri MCA 2997]KAI3609597.1 asteroid-like protein 1 [Moniliophthora roreri]
MGVHGLTTYLRENKRKLSTTTTVRTQEIPQIPIHFVIDGWSFIYELHLKSGFPWVYGGEYPEYTRLVRTVTEAWVDLGFRLSFVFDGPCPAIKFGTEISRTAKAFIEPSLLFFRTSSTSRSTARFLAESRIIPPLSYNATINALLAVRESTDAVDVHFADEEGDAYAVELAGRLGAYVVGNDSDFVILNTEGYLGYAHLEEMVWTCNVLEEDHEANPDDDFVQVSRKRGPIKVKDPKLGRGVIPPEDRTDLSFTFTAYSPSTLASHLHIPITLLPLLGALVGNDFSNQNALPGRQVQQLFFERRMTLSARIDLVAATLQSIISNAQQKRKTKYQVDSVMDLINITVNALLNRSPTTMGTGEIDAVVDRIVESTLQYAITKYEGQDGTLWPSTLCALHEPDVCPMLPIFSRRIAAGDWQEDDMESKELLIRDEVRKLLLEAYRSGKLSPMLVDCLNTGTFWPRFFLENPDVESVSRMTRPIRQWCCSILHDAVGLPEFTEEEAGGVENSDGVKEEESDADDDELIDVVEENSEEDEDLLAPLRGALRQLKTDENEGSTNVSDPSYTLNPSPAPQAKRNVRVTEYVRRGTRVADEILEIPLLADLLEAMPDSLKVDSSSPIPLLLQSPHQRLAVMIRLLENNSSLSIEHIPPQKVLAVLALRWVVRSLHERAQQIGSKDSQSACWTAREGRCFLASFSAPSEPTETQIKNHHPPILDRHVQLTAQILQTMDAIEQLAQVLLLTEQVPSTSHLFSGRNFHNYLTADTPLGDGAMKELWDHAVEGVEGCFGEDRQKKRKVKTKISDGVQKPTPPGTPTKTPGKAGTGGRLKGGVFDLLGDAEA